MRVFVAGASGAIGNPPVLVWEPKNAALDKHIRKAAEQAHAAGRAALARVRLSGLVEG
jgi:hypothetical protein